MSDKLHQRFIITQETKQPDFNKSIELILEIGSRCKDLENGQKLLLDGEMLNLIIRACDLILKISNLSNINGSVLSRFRSQKYIQMSSIYKSLDLKPNETERFNKFLGKCLSGQEMLKTGLTEEAHFGFVFDDTEVIQKDQEAQSEASDAFVEIKKMLKKQNNNPYNFKPLYENIVDRIDEDSNQYLIVLKSGIRIKILKNILKSEINRAIVLVRKGDKREVINIRRGKKINQNYGDRVSEALLVLNKWLQTQDD